jgi:hypothetical protein
LTCQVCPRPLEASWSLEVYDFEIGARSDDNSIAVSRDIDALLNGRLICLDVNILGVGGSNPRHKADRERSLLELG